MENNELDGYMEFFYQASHIDPAITVRISPQSDLSEACAAFGQFLRGAGYVFEGEIQIVNEDSVPQDSQAEFN